MASLTFRRPNWSLEISRSHRTFAIVFLAPERSRQSHTRRFISSSPSTSRTCRHTAYASGPRQSSTIRSLFSSSNAFRAQEPSTQDSKPTTARSPSTFQAPIQNANNNFSDQPLTLNESDPSQVDWARSFHGLSSEPFSKEAADILMAPLAENDIEIKPDGILYLPEIKYRRIMNKAFGPGGWGLAPRGESIVTAKAVTREYALVAQGRLVSIARGEMNYFSPEDIPTAAEGCKSNALMRCCKDLGIASELWDPRFIRSFKEKHTREVFVEHAVSKKRSKIWVRRGDSVNYPWKETKGFTPVNGAKAT